MNEIIKRAAEAAEAVDPTIWVGEDRADYYERVTRAVILAMRDNPPKGLEKVVYHGDYGDDVWRDSIDEALK